MSNDPKQADGISDVVRSPIALEGEAGEGLAEDDRDLAAGAIVESTDESELMSKPIVIESRPESEAYIELETEPEAYDGSWSPKNTNVETIES